jgi:hypothetical protein
MYIKLKKNQYEKDYELAMTSLTSTNLAPPQSFLTTYDWRTGVELFDLKDRCWLKLLTHLMNLFILKVLSPRCFHQWGGSKMMLREAHAWINLKRLQVDPVADTEPKACFIYKTDVYSYYASINHEILIQQVKMIGWPQHLLATVIAYIKRTILCLGPSVHCQRGIPKGGSLSPILGALYLTPLDHAMERWMKREDCFYARFQDDILLMSHKRHVLRRMRKAMYRILDDLKLTLRPEKTFIGRIHKGFDLLGYHISTQSLTPNQTTQKKAIEQAKRRYAQGGEASLQGYLYRWRSWVHAGLPSHVYKVDDAVELIRNAVILSNTYTNSQRLNNCPLPLCVAEGNTKHKGKRTCLINIIFSEHRY